MLDPTSRGRSGYRALLPVLELRCALKGSAPGCRTPHQAGTWTWPCWRWGPRRLPWLPAGQRRTAVGGTLSGDRRPAAAGAGRPANNGPSGVNQGPDSFQKRSRWQAGRSTPAVSTPNLAACSRLACFSCCAQKSWCKAGRGGNASRKRWFECRETCMEAPMLPPAA